MTTAATGNVQDPLRSIATRRDTLAGLIQTTKPGITKLVTITSMVGFAMAAVSRSWSAMEFVAIAAACMVGTALSAAGANAINQWMERDRDGRMPRTAHRPIPSARVSGRLVLTFGVALGVIGCLLLWAVCGLASALVSLACLLVYVILYTPLKPVTTLATLIGGIPGALPPLIGWCAAQSRIGFDADMTPLMQAAGWSLFALMFVWQIPHFLAIAWMYKDDYEQGGYRVLNVTDGNGERTTRAILVWSALLVPATVLPALYMSEWLGLVYPVVAIVSSVAFFALAVRLAITRTRAHARAVFFGSIMHLPLLMFAMVAEALLRAVLA